MRDVFYLFACLFAPALIFSCKNKPAAETVVPVIVGGLQLNQQSGADCSLADEMARMDCARLDLHWPVIEQGGDALKKSVAQWVSDYIGGVLNPSSDGKTATPGNVEAAAKTFFENHSREEKSAQTGGWLADSRYEVLLNDGQYLTLEITAYTYQGGAHGSPTAAVATFDILSGQRLGWDDFVSDKAALQTLAEKIYRDVRADIFQPADGSEPFVFDENTPFALAQNYGLVPQGIYCHYIAYEVGPYVIGSTQMTIPFDAMGNLVKIKAPGAVSDGPALNLPYFGSYNLAAWNKLSSNMEAGGDAEIASIVYEKDGFLMQIDTSSRGEYGYGITYKLTGPNGGVLKTRSLVFGINPNAVTETVADFTVTPAQQYSRRQVLAEHFSQLNPLPAAASGKWKMSIVKTGTKPAVPATRPKPATRPAKAGSAAPARPTVVLKQNGDILLDGKDVGSLDNLRKSLQATLLKYNAIPEKVNFKTVGQTGMGTRAEIRDFIDESIAGAKWVRKKAALAAMNAAVGKKLGMSTQLEVVDYRSSGVFTFISARPKHTDGRAIDYSKTVYAADHSAAWFSDNAIGLLRYEKGAWKVLAYTIGVEKAPASVWVKKFGAPRGLFGR